MRTGDYIFLAFFSVGALVYYGLRVLFLLTIYRCLHHVHPKNRRLQPVLVWLDLIPCFNLVWGFVIVFRVGESLEAEFFDLWVAGLSEDEFDRLDLEHARQTHRGSYGRGAGMSWMIAVSLTPLFVYLAVLVAVIFWFVYWKQITGYSRSLAAAGVDYDDFGDEAE